MPRLFVVAVLLVFVPLAFARGLQADEKEEDLVTCFKFIDEEARAYCAIVNQQLNHFNGFVTKYNIPTKTDIHANTTQWGKDIESLCLEPLVLDSSNPLQQLQGGHYQNWGFKKVLTLTNGPVTFYATYLSQEGSLVGIGPSAEIVNELRERYSLAYPFVSLQPGDAIVRIINLMQGERDRDLALQQLLIKETELQGEFASLGEEKDIQVSVRVAKVKAKLEGIRAARQYIADWEEFVTIGGGSERSLVYNARQLFLASKSQRLDSLAKKYPLILQATMSKI